MSLQASIIGAGFSGLTLAYFLNQNGYKVTIYEKADKCAGLLQSPMTDFGVIDHAANGLINSQDLIDLCNKAGIDILYPSEDSKKKYLFVDGKMTRWPFSFLESIKLIIKLFKFKRNKQLFEPLEKETLEDWVARSFDKNLLRKLVEPAFQGVYACRANKLSARLVTKNLFSTKTKGKSRVKRQTVSFKGGMQEFCQKLSEYLISDGVVIKYNSNIEKLELTHSHFLTGNINSTLNLINEFKPELATKMSELKSLSIAKISCFVEKSKLSFEGFGCLFAKGEGFNSLGVLFDSSIFPTRYKDYSLHTWIMGEEQLETCQNDEQILSCIHEDIKRLWGKDIEIKNTDIKVWKKTLPLYDSMLESVIKKYNFDQEVYPNLYLFGNYTGDLGLSQILEKAKSLATRINYEQTQ